MSCRFKLDQFVLDKSPSRGTVEVNYSSDRDLDAQVRLSIHEGFEGAAVSLSLDELADVVTMLKQFIDGFEVRDPFSDTPF